MNEKDKLLKTMLLKFKNRREALLWINAAIEKLPRAPEVMDCNGLATAIHFLKNQTGQLSENLKEHVNKHKDFLLKHLIPESMDELILCGLDPQKSLNLSTYVKTMI